MRVASAYRSAATEALGIISLYSDFGVKSMKASVGMDASAAIGIIQRQGLGKLRHVEVDVLWLQEQRDDPYDCPIAHSAVRIIASTNPNKEGVVERRAELLDDVVLRQAVQVAVVHRLVCAQP